MHLGSWFGLHVSALEKIPSKVWNRDWGGGGGGGESPGKLPPR